MRFALRIGWAMLPIPAQDGGELLLIQNVAMQFEIRPNHNNLETPKANKALKCLIFPSPFKSKIGVKSAAGLWNRVHWFEGSRITQNSNQLFEIAISERQRFGIKQL